MNFATESLSRNEPGRTPVSLYARLGDLNFVSFSGVSEYSSSRVFSQPFKNVKLHLSPQPFKHRQWAGFDPGTEVGQLLSLPADGEATRHRGYWALTFSSSDCDVLKV